MQTATNSPHHTCNTTNDQRQCSPLSAFNWIAQNEKRKKPKEKKKKMKILELLAIQNKKSTLADLEGGGGGAELSLDQSAENISDRFKRLVLLALVVIVVVVVVLFGAVIRLK
mmetsp:Transcript_32195/g.63739  ORF Transcript_32195/g.63739 Transcript_32195/m.63739 type:complete len:113 (-) Transcript_32195:44-382(-)